MEPLPGYVLVRYLGAGCIGDVWEASGPGGTAAALKFIRLAGASGLKEYRAIQRVKRLVHPNLNTITACWLLDGEGKVLNPGKRAAEVSADGPAATLVIAMLLGAMSLQARLKQCLGEGLPGIPVDELLGYMEDAARGLDYLNQKDHGLEADDPGPVQHGDIKPLNLLVVGDATQICDFGLATALQDHRRTLERSAGTPAYMAPEICRNEPPCPTTDQYSLAISYYELRTGQLPMSDQDLVSVARVAEAHKKNRLTFGLVCDGEQYVLRQATSLQPGDRFASCREFVRMLSRAVENDRIRETVDREPGDPRKTRPDLNRPPVAEASRRADPAAEQTTSEDPASARATQGDDLPRIADSNVVEEPAPIRRTRPEHRLTIKQTRQEPPAPPLAQPLRDTVVQPPSEPPPKTRRLAPVAGGVLAVLALVAFGASSDPPWWGLAGGGAQGDSPKEFLVDPNKSDQPQGPGDAIQSWETALSHWRAGERDSALRALPGLRFPEDWRRCFPRLWKAHDGPVDTVAVSPDGRNLLSASHRELRRWEWGDADPRHTTLDVPDTLETMVLTFSENGDYLIAGSLSGDVALWPATNLSGAPLRMTPFPSRDDTPPLVLSVAANAAWLAAGADDGLVAAWPLPGGGPAGLSSPIWGRYAEDSTDISGVTALEDDLLFIDAQGRLVLARLTADGLATPRILYRLGSAGICLRRNDRLLAAADEDGVHVWEIAAVVDAIDSGASLPATRDFRRFPKRVATCRLLTWDGRDFVVVLTHAQQLYFWSLDNDQDSFQVSLKDLTQSLGEANAAALALAPSPDGRLALALDSGWIGVLDPSALTLLLAARAVPASDVEPFSSE